MLTVGRNISRIRRGCSAREGWKEEGMYLIGSALAGALRSWGSYVRLRLGFSCIATVLAARRGNGVGSFTLFSPGVSYLGTYPFLSFSFSRLWGEIRWLQVGFALNVHSALVYILGFFWCWFCGDVGVGWGACEGAGERQGGRDYGRVWRTCWGCGDVVGCTRSACVCVCV